MFKRVLTANTLDVMSTSDKVNEFECVFNV